MGQFNTSAAKAILSTLPYKDRRDPPVSHGAVNVLKIEKANRERRSVAKIKDREYL